MQKQCMTMKVYRLLNFRSFLSIAILATSVQCLSNESPIRFLTENDPPVNYLDSHNNPAGFSVELLQLIWKQMNQSNQPIEVIPWARGFYLAQVQKNTALFATSRTQKREHLFKWVCPINQSDVVLIGKQISKNKPIHQLKIGLVRSDIAEEVLSSLTPAPVEQVKTRSVEQLVRLLETNKVDAIATFSAVGYTTMRNLNIDAAKYPILVKLYEQQDCFAFNKQTSDSIITQYQQALNFVRETNEYNELLSRYHMLAIK